LRSEAGFITDLDIWTRFFTDLDLPIWTAVFVTDLDIFLPIWISGHFLAKPILKFY
jgi:hypothetical protein